MFTRFYQKKKYIYYEKILNTPSGAHRAERPSLFPFAFWHFDSVLWEADGVPVIADLMFVV